ncbi:hypothetical protein BGW80DRAFT_1455156 [Lactifluus volemus]|nr:hypothetical protein BGW80DRAFT_1455156 [Lactifluus volemus]
MSSSLNPAQQYIFDDHTPFETVERYALEFIAARALELGKEEEWEDLCGRRANGVVLSQEHPYASTQICSLIGIANMNLSVFDPPLGALL